MKLSSASCLILWIQLSALCSSAPPPSVSSAHSLANDLQNVTASINITSSTPSKCLVPKTFIPYRNYTNYLQLLAPQPFHLQDTTIITHHSVSKLPPTAPSRRCGPMPASSLQRSNFALVFRPALRPYSFPDQLRLSQSEVTPGQRSMADLVWVG